MHAAVQPLPPLGVGTHSGLRPLVVCLIGRFLASFLHLAPYIPHHRATHYAQGVREDLRGILHEVPLRGPRDGRSSVPGYILCRPRPDGHVSDHHLPPDGPRDDDRSLRHSPRKGYLFKKESERDGLRR